EIDRPGDAALLEEGARLFDEFAGEVERVQSPVAEFPEAEAHAAGAAAGFKHAAVGSSGQVLLEDGEFRSPEAELMSGTGVVYDGAEVVEVGLDLAGGDFRGGFGNHGWTGINTDATRRQ